MGVGKNREGEVFYLMMMLVDKILCHEWKMNILKDKLCNDTSTKKKNLKLICPPAAICTTPPIETGNEECSLFAKISQLSQAHSLLSLYQGWWKAGGVCS